MWSERQHLVYFFLNVGLFVTAACRPIVPLPQWIPLIHLQRRHAPHRHKRPLPSKEGTTQGILLAHRNSRRYWVLLHAAKLGRGTDSFTSPPKEGMQRNFFQMTEKSNDFGQVWTRELGYQSKVTTRPPKPSDPYLSKGRSCLSLLLSVLVHLWIVVRKFVRVEHPGDRQKHVIAFIFVIVFIFSTLSKHESSLDRNCRRHLIYCVIFTSLTADALCWDVANKLLARPKSFRKQSQDKRLNV